LGCAAAVLDGFMRDRAAAQPGANLINTAIRRHKLVRRTIAITYAIHYDDYSEGGAQGRIAKKTWWM